MDLHDFVISENKVKWIDQNSLKLGKDGASVTLKVPQNVLLMDFHYRRVKKSGLKMLLQNKAFPSTVRTHLSESDKALLTGQSKTYKNREDYQERKNWVEDQDIWITFTGANVKPVHPEHPDTDGGGTVDPDDGGGGGGGSNVVDPAPSDAGDTDDDGDGDKTAQYIAVAVAVGLVALLVLYLYLKNKKDKDK